MFGAHKGKYIFSQRRITDHMLTLLLNNVASHFHSVLIICLNKNTMHYRLICDSHNLPDFGLTHKPLLDTELQGKLMSLGLLCSTGYVSSIPTNMAPPGTRCHKCCRPVCTHTRLRANLLRPALPSVILSSVPSLKKKMDHLRLL